LGAAVALFLCFIGQNDVIKQDIVLPVFVMTVDAVTLAMLEQRFYWKAVNEGIQDRDDQPTALGELARYCTKQL
jgi:hypothetical protein